MIKCSLSEAHTLTLETEGAILRGLRPILNETLLEDVSCEVRRSDDEMIELRYTAAGLGDGAFWLRATRLPTQDRISIQYWLEDLPQDLLLDSFGLHFEQVENLRQFLRNGYFSWDGSYYVQPDSMTGLGEDMPQLTRGYGMCQLLPRHGNGCLILGFDRHDRFQQTFTLDWKRRPPALTIQTLWDRKGRSGLKRCESEQLLVFSHEEMENGLREWARLAAYSSPRPPRLSSPPITGWCSWYNLYAYINEENILVHLRAAQTVSRREKLPMRVFQIDDGFTPEMGDWLEVKPQFPRGMKAVLDDIRSAGFIPGLWIAPFMVGNRSHLYRDHPDWVVKDRETGKPLTHMRFYGEFRWHKRSEEYYILDSTHPAAFEYLKNVFQTWRQDWGCEYFKTDFMHFGSEYGPDRAVWHSAGMTRIEIWRHTAEMIRAEIGDALWLGCGCPLWASIGLVDGVRSGRDVGVKWTGNYSAESLLRDQASRNFANQILWQSDPDCVLLREQFNDLSEKEVESLAIYAGMSGGVMMTSDHLGELSPQRLNLWRLILQDKRVSCDFPLLGQSPIFYERLPENSSSDPVRYLPRAEDPVLVQVRHPKRSGQLGVIFILNTGTDTVQRSYPFASLGIKKPVYLFDWQNKSSTEQAESRIAVTLQGHHSVLYFFSGEPIYEAPRQLPS